MKILLRVDRDGLRDWRAGLAERLARRGSEVGIMFVPGKTEPSDDGYLVIDLAAEPSDAGQVWRVECDGAGLEAGLTAAARAGRPPTICVRAGDRTLALARPGSEFISDPKIALNDMLQRTATLIEAAIDGAALATPAPDESGATCVQRKRAALSAAGRTVTRAVYRALFHAPHWRVGWRRGRGAFADGGGWSDLPDDGRRFYADPFPFAVGGRTFLFVEDFVHSAGKGVISVVEFGPCGPLGPPRPVLERPFHLSYPFVFQRDGAVWMVPESVEAGAIALYRAVEFPFRWSHERTLVTDVRASDPTLFESQDRWWMFATVCNDGGSSSDALWLWSARDFRGPWQPHRRNPALIDIASARPAGRLFERGAALYRPVQDCRAGYGAALGLARIERLDEDGFAQNLETVVRPGGRDWPGSRLHTFNAAGGWEFIDGSAFAPRWSVLRGLASLADGARAKS